MNSRHEFKLVELMQIGTATKLKWPHLKLSNGLMDMTILLPDKKKGYYRGSRFDWSGMTWQVSCNGHTYFEEVIRPHHPDAPDGARGIAEEFGILSPLGPLGYEEAKVGELFLKIGVGLLEKGNEPDYGFWISYKILRPLEWKIRNGKDWIEFSQEITNINGWGYNYLKLIEMAKGKPEFTVSYILRNIGSKLIRTDQYAHNLIVIDKIPPGKDYVIEFPFKVEAEKDLKGIAEARGKQIIFTRPVAEKEAIYSPIVGFDNSVSDIWFIVKNMKTGGEVKVSGNFPISKIAFWAGKTALSVEPFYAINLQPGETTDWRRQYALK